MSDPKVNLDPTDQWVLERHFALKEAKFFGKVLLTYENGVAVNRKIEVNEKPPKV